jgi:hypothetical protein
MLSSLEISSQKITGKGKFVPGTYLVSHHEGTLGNEVIATLFLDLSREKS